MRKLRCLAGFMLILMTCAFQATPQDATDKPIEWIGTLGRGTVRQAVLSADGERVAAAGTRGVWIYDTQFEDIAHLETGPVEQIAWSDDDLYLAVMTEGGYVSIWDMLDYRLHSEIKFPDNAPPSMRIEPITWKPDSHVLTMAYYDEILLWNTDRGIFEDPITIRTEHHKTDLAWHPDGTRLAVAALGEVQIWNVPGGEPLFDIDLGEHERSTRSVYMAWNPDGTRLAAVENWSNNGYIEHSNTLSIIDAATGAITLVMQAGLAADVAWSPNGTMIATATASFGSRLRTPINVWNAQTGALVAEMISHTREAHSVQWHPDGEQLLSAANDNHVYLWQLQPEGPVKQIREYRVLRGHLDQVNALDWTPDSRRIATGSEDGSIRVWDVVSGKVVETDYQVDLFGVQALDYSPDGRYLAAGGGEDWVRIWGLNEEGMYISAQYQHGRSLNAGEGTPFGITAVQWNPDGKMLASAGFDSVIKLWRETGDVSILRQGVWSALSLHWFPEGTRLLIGTRGPEIWDTVSGKPVPINCENAPRDNFFALELSPDGRYLIVSDEMGPLFLCDLQTGKRFSMQAEIMDWNPVYPVAVARDRGDGSGQKLILFDPLDSEKRIAEFTADAPVQTAVWSPDGRSLALAMKDGTVQLWSWSGRDY